MSILQRRLVRVAAAAVAVVGWGALPTGAKASLIGDTITITTQANVPLDTWTDMVLVGAGAELAGGDGSNHANTNQGQGFPDLFAGDFIDVGESSVTFNYAALGSSLGFPYAFTTDFLDLDWVGPDGPGTLHFGLAEASGDAAFDSSGR